MTPLRVLLYTPVVPTEAGGVQAVYRRTAAFLAARGHAVVRAWPIDDPAAPEPRPRRWPSPGEVLTLRLPRLEDRRLPLGRPRPTPRGLLHAADPLRRLRSTLRGFRPRVVDVHFPRGGTRWFASSRRRAALVLTCHGSDLLQPLPADAARLRALLRRADRIIAVSAGLAERAETLRAGGHRPAFPRAPVEVIPNGVDLAFWRRPDDAAAAPAALACVGRLERVKGHDVLLRALARLRASVPAARLTLVGDGPEAPALRSLAAELGLGDAVRFAGRLDPAATAALLHASSVAVMPSRSEGLPLALLEAMAAGLPPVVTRVGGMPDALGEPPAGRIVAPEDPAALAASLAALLADPAARAALAAAAVRRAAAFSAAAADLRHAEVLEEAALSRPGRSPAR
ncbi:glycosyltransferase [Phycisphaera mikurensis]|uniref:Glycosyltransferase n=1 Tax=Phycisphaera mikurensis (strain NBRC 102666 / KCTC 22515 / FYK2301M01) TaxID=1142394 RepID=I0IE35_PHYMF|nr:glycosyltransferase [Phycisphaera mikurensis]MBB6441328.1 glycosyltransferase involved in cell wall biosynthesis [Phycisphaera mikurensis]BAM03523.1 glycosyltransferase [Phycisphaera mikurensis NBRC 102666]